MHTYKIIIYRAHAGMENQYRIPMDQYQNIAILYILNQKCMILIIEKSKGCIVDVICYPYKSCLCTC